MDKATVNRLIQEAQSNLDGGMVWQYITNNTNIEEIAKQPGTDSIVAVGMAAFYAGMKFALENVDFVETGD